MVQIKAVIRFSALILYTFLCYSVFFPMYIFSFFGLNPQPWRNKVLKAWGKGCLSICKVQLRVQGKPPKAPFFLVSNHLSYLDVFVYLSLTDGVFISKMEVRNWLFLGYMMQTLGMLFVDRESRNDVTRVNNLIAKGITPTQGVILFPEGTTSGGFHVLPFKSSLLEYPGSASFPVSVAAIQYRTEKGEPPASSALCWWGDAEFVTHLLHLLKMKKSYAFVTFGENKFVDNNRKNLAAVLFQAVNECFTKNDQIIHANEL